jgi:hypothetical protein
MACGPIAFSVLSTCPSTLIVQTTKDWSTGPFCTLSEIGPTVVGKVGVLIVFVHGSATFDSDSLPT